MVVALKVGLVLLPPCMLPLTSLGRLPSEVLRERLGVGWIGPARLRIVGDFGVGLNVVVVVVVVVEAGVVLKGIGLDIEREEPAQVGLVKGGSSSLRSVRWI
jgi:hypothetical protein